MPPVAGAWDPVTSLGQPPRTRVHLGLGYGVDRALETAASGVTGSLGAYRDLANPMYGLLGISGEAYLSQRGLRFDAGARVLLASPALFVHGGLDWDARRSRTDLLLGTSFPLRRGGWPTPGAEIRVDWLPARRHSALVTASLPLRQPLAGRTRSRTVDVELPDPPAASRAPPPPPGTPTAAALGDVAESMRWLMALHTFFWLADVQSLSHEETIAQWRAALGAFRSEMAKRESLRPADGTHEREVRRYHAALDRAFGLALGAAGNDAEATGRELGDRARRVALEEVVLPYNRTVGRYKQPDVLDGLVARARARVIAWLALNPEAHGGRAQEVLAVLDAWMDGFEVSRQELARRARDSRMHWLPLAFVLRPEEHRTQSQIDALVEEALERPLEGGNAFLYLNAPQFQVELLRSIHDTETYHVLWIHDFRGRDGAGRVDRTGFRITAEGYLRALLDRVRAYDETGRLPVYLILLDQFYYEANDGRLWMTLLERPLDHRLELPGDDGDLGRRLSSLQDSLRVAVAASNRLQAEAEAFGPSWIDRVVKVHVNVTNRSDLTFRSRRLLGPRIGADNLIRDHRKIVIRDASESDPGAGEVILSGVGVGDHYATSTWDDRTLLLQGPGALEARDMARKVLLQNGLREQDIPHVLRPSARTEGYWERIRELESRGADARVLQAHNDTGWGPKEATFVQMLLYDLVPPGTVLYVPDSLWTSYQWMAQLVNAALRGCRVFVVAPALENAPSAGFPQMSVMQELISRLVLVQEEFGAMIDRAGGELRVGLYTRRAPVDDVRALLSELGRTYAEHPFLEGVFPLSDETRDLIQRLEKGDIGLPRPAPRLEDVHERLPLLHRKTQLLVSGKALARLGAAPELPAALDAVLLELSEAEPEPTESGPLVDQARTRLALRLVELHRSLVADATDGDEGDEDVLYFMVGSINKNVRSMALDGEVLALVSGPWALQAFYDFVMFSGGVTWVRGVSDVEALLPPYSPLRRRIARWLHSVI